jgi:hypothetical protein
MSGDKLDIIILALAVFRLSNLIANEDGPLKMFDNLQEKLSYRAQTDGGVWVQAHELVSCPYCLSVWLGVAWAILFYTAPNASTWLALPFALSAITLILDRWVNG